MKIACRATVLAVACFALAAHSWPRWIDNLPQAGKGADYYYLTTSGEALTADSARVKARSEAIVKIASSMGLHVTIEEDGTVRQGSVENLRIPMKEVCEYDEPIGTRRGVRVYMLLQVMNDANKTSSGFRQFDCKKNREITD
jgi:hypothetical protein